MVYVVRQWKVWETCYLSLSLSLYLATHECTFYILFVGTKLSVFPSIFAEYCNVVVCGVYLTYSVIFIRFTICISRLWLI